MRHQMRFVNQSRTRNALQEIKIADCLLLRHVFQLNVVDVKIRAQRTQSAGSHKNVVLRLPVHATVVEESDDIFDGLHLA